MLSKCANPECPALFRYFHQGKLFRLDTEGPPDRRRHLGKDPGTNRPLRRIEFYWLCDACAERMTIAFDRDTGVSVQPRAAREALHVPATAA